MKHVFADHLPMDTINSETVFRMLRRAHLSSPHHQWFPPPTTSHLGNPSTAYLSLKASHTSMALPLQFPPPEVPLSSWVNCMRAVKHTQNLLFWETFPEQCQLSVIQHTRVSVYCMDMTGTITTPTLQ